MPTGIYKRTEKTKKILTKTSFNREYWIKYFKRLKITLEEEI